MFFSWFWVLCGVVVLLVTVAPTLFWRKYRLRNAALLCMLWITFVIAASVRNLNALEGVLLRYNSDNHSYTKEFDLFLQSGSAGLGIAVRESVSWHNLGSNPLGKPWVSWFRTNKKYPEFRDSIVDKWGFSVSWFGESDRPGASSTRHFWAFVCPSWFPLPFLFTTPAIWFRRFIYRRKSLRWAREGRCAHCGYDLRSSPDKCPECGTIPKPPKQPATSPAAPAAGI